MPAVPDSSAGLSLQDLSDRFSIQDLIVAEAAAIDERDWDQWESVYTPDAVIDWTGNDAIKGNPKEVRAWASKVLSTENFPYPQYQHFCTNMTVRVSGDEATCRTMQIIPISVPSPGGGRQIGFSGIWFEDKLVRTPAGWRIRARVEHLAWRHNFPPAYETPEPETTTP
jgi:SnoaL-like domain